MKLIFFKRSRGRTGPPELGYVRELEGEEDVKVKLEEFKEKFRSFLRYFKLGEAVFFKSISPLVRSNGGQVIKRHGNFREAEF